MTDAKYFSLYDPSHIRVLARKYTEKYSGLKESHVFWIAKKLDIYPDGVENKFNKGVDMHKTGKINKKNIEYVSSGKINDKGLQAIEAYIEKEGYKPNENYKGEQMAQTQNTNIWEQADLISMMKNEYDKAVAERDTAKSEAEQYCQLADKYEKEIEDLKDKLLICEKENNELKTEKKELGKMQLKTVDFNKEIEELQKRIAQYNAEVNAVSAEVNEFRKDVSVLLTGVTQLQDKKKKLEGVMSDLVGCSKRLMNMK